MQLTTTKPGRIAARYIKSIAVGRGDYGAAAAYASAQRWIQSNEIAEALKAAVGSMSSTSDPSLATAIGQDVAALVAPFSVVAQLRSSFRLVPPRTAVVSQVTGASAHWGDALQSGGKAIPASAGSFTRVALDEKRVAAFAVFANELARSSAPEAEGVIAADVGRAIGAKVDWTFLDPFTSGSPSEAPASVTASGRIFSSTGTTTDAIDADLEKLITAVSNGGSDLASGVFILNTLSAARLARLRGSSGAPAYPGMSAKGGTLLGFPCLATSNIPRSGSPSPGGSFAFFVDPSRIWMTDRDAVRIEASAAALVQLDNAPTMDASSGTGATATSLFQTDSIAIKATRYLGWQPVAGTSHAATLTSVEW